VSTPLLIAIQISLVGLAVVFASLLGLWLLMALLVRLTPEPVERPSKPAEADQRAAAAAAAVAVALALQADRPPLAVPPTATVSAWQAVMRGRQLKQRGSIR
jgi:Na+-transporting methylmalonyl-CoA/oxaloacetate decarboxylase gamma subunit